MSRIINIDALRGVSVLMIVMLHISALSDIPKSNISSILIQFMSYGVPFFFVISGFVISLTSQNLFNGQTLNNFFIKRALKIIPLYFLFLFFWLFIFYIFNEINIQCVFRLLGFQRIITQLIKLILKKYSNPFKVARVPNNNNKINKNDFKKIFKPL